MPESFWQEEKKETFGEFDDFNTDGASCWE